MRNWNRYVGLVMLCGAFCGSWGCAVAYTSQVRQISVRDAETEAPIAGARLSVTYLYVLCTNPPAAASAVTDRQGNATIQTTTFPDQYWRAEASGYLGCRNCTSYRPPAAPLEFRLYAEPAAQVMITFPRDYHGLVQINLQPSEKWIQETPGKRSFSYQASPAGYVAISATPLLLENARFTAAYDDGTAVPAADPKAPAATEFRGVGTYGNRRLYFVGNEADASATGTKFANLDPKKREALLGKSQ